MSIDTSLLDTRYDPELPLIMRFVDVIYKQTGYDFRNYAFSSFKRRIKKHALFESLTLEELHDLIKNDGNAMSRLLVAITVHVTSMFRDPDFFLLFRKSVVPLLRTYPFVRLWVAGCSTGQEVYSLAIILQEEDLYSRCRIYATDVSDLVLKAARAGIYPLSAMQEYTRNYQHSGGLGDFSDYYTTDSENAIFRPALRQNVIFASHNLASDASFNEFHWISCRNVMIYFNRTLQNRVHGLFAESLLTFGYLGLGRSESLRFSSHQHLFDSVSTKDRIYRKVL